MCNLYANTTSQAAMREIFQVIGQRDHLGNYRGQSAIWPKYEAPVVRISDDGERELVEMHWGFLTPQVSKKTGKPIKPAAWNNARDDKLRSSGLWKDSFLNRRCLIPGSAFREAKGRNPATDYWFAIKGSDARPPFAFAGLWRAGQPGIDDETGDWLTHTIVTTTANDLVKPVNPTRMPVILDEQDYGTWLTGSAEDAAQLLRPYPSGQMGIFREGIGITSDDASAGGD
ncbi:MAG: SOS response-associated peptidase [Paracoccus sp. (in: a-proteobacteria)]|nr:SOS response-associated peptidase [Paracoccus sp. (in: a-proteobacteria)]